MVGSTCKREAWYLYPHSRTWDLRLVRTPITCPGKSYLICLMPVGTATLLVNLSSPGTINSSNHISTGEFFKLGHGQKISRLLQWRLVQGINQMGSKPWIVICFSLYQQVLGLLRSNTKIRNPEPWTSLPYWLPIIFIVLTPPPSPVDSLRKILRLSISLLRNTESCGNCCFLDET
ncbi:hypothetical protein F5Y15DRAFT_23158 [Xylariaceae sp. FL0016]|nr:hypothetical protein F5Y15DRAFT_23158 [Xylariaceae sp. FL0016]